MFNHTLAFVHPRHGRGGPTEAWTDLCRPLNRMRTCWNGWCAVVISQKPCCTGVEEFPTGGILVVNL